MKGVYDYECNWKKPYIEEVIELLTEEEKQTLKGVLNSSQNPERRFLYGAEDIITDADKGIKKLILGVFSLFTLGNITAGKTELLTFSQVTPYNVPNILIDNEHYSCSIENGKLYAILPDLESGKRIYLYFN